MYLNCHSYFSFKYGTMSPEQLLAGAQSKGITQLALTDCNNTSGILDFFRLAPKYNIKPIAGIDFRNGAEQKFIGIGRNKIFLHKHLDGIGKRLKDSPRTRTVWTNTVLHESGNDTLKIS